MSYFHGKVMLRSLFSPKSVAVIGASRNPGKLGYEVLKNLMDSGFPGEIYPVNPKSSEILGFTCFPGIRNIDQEVDLAVVMIPARFVISCLEDCGKKGVKAAIVISAGFRETGHEGLLAEREMARLAEKYGMAILGPNCLGLIDTNTPLNASFAADMPIKGNIAFMSQSGALCTAILDMSFGRGLGFSSFVSLGNKAHLNEIDLLNYWKDDPNTRVVIAYLEGIADGARFIEAASAFTKVKPLVAVKAGVTNAGSKAVSSHTGSLAGSENAYEAAFKQSGVIRAGSVEDLFDLAQALSLQPLPLNDQVAVVTNAGGPGIMATDALEKAGLRLASLAQPTMKELSERLPPAASVINPVDVLGDALADRYETALDTLSRDNNVGAIMVILTPQIMTQVEETAKTVAKVAMRTEKPILACFMGQANTAKGVEILSKHQIPNYLYPERAVQALKAMVYQKRWQEKTSYPIHHFDVDAGRVRLAIEQARKSGRLELGESEARNILAAYGVPMPKSRICKNADEAVAFADEVGYPVVMKISSPDILHKTDIGGVKLGITGPGDVKDSFDLLVFRALRYMPDAEIFGCMVQKQVKGGTEVIVGMNRDPQFGPLVMFGLGGIYVEVMKDVAFRIAPFSRTDAVEMIEEIRSSRLLHGVRGEGRKDIDALVDILLRVSQLATDFPEIVELDINPLVVFKEGQGVSGIDMRLVISD